MLIVELISLKNGSIKVVLNESVVVLKDFDAICLIFIMHNHLFQVLRNRNILFLTPQTLSFEVSDFISQGIDLIIE